MSGRSAMLGRRAGARRLVPRGASSSSAAPRAIARVQELIRRRAAHRRRRAHHRAKRAPAVEAVARELHARPPLGAPYVTVDCGAADRPASTGCCSAPPPDLATARPAIVEPLDRRDSCVAAARGGTLFLHNVTELPRRHAGAAGADRARRRGADRRRAGRHRAAAGRERAARHRRRRPRAPLPRRSLPPAVGGAHRPAAAARSARRRAGARGAAAGKTCAAGADRRREASRRPRSRCSAR